MHFENCVLFQSSTEFSCTMKQEWNPALRVPRYSMATFFCPGETLEN